MNSVDTIQAAAVANRNRLLRFGASLLMASGSAGFSLVWVLLAIARFHASPFQLGIAASIIQATTIVFSWVLGRLADRVGHRVLPLFSGVCFGIFAALLMRSTSMAHIYWLMLAQGVCLGAFWPSMEASFGQNAHGAGLLRSIGFFNLSWSSGVAIGPLYAGYLFANIRPMAFYIPALCSIAAGSSILLLRSRVEVHAHTHTKGPGLPKPVGKDAYLYAGWVANFGAWFLVGVLRSIFPKLCETLKLSGTEIGFLLFLWAFVLASMFWILSRSPWWTYRHAPLQVFQGILIVASLIIFRASTMPLLVFGTIVAGVGCGLTYSSSLFYALDGFSDKGEKAGIHEVVLGTGSLIGPFLCGWAAASYSIRAPYPICAIVVLGCMLAVSILLRRGREEP